MPKWRIESIQRKDPLTGKKLVNLNTGEAITDLRRVPVCKTAKSEAPPEGFLTMAQNNSGLVAVGIAPEQTAQPIKSK